MSNIEIIAEIGVNHNGNPMMAADMIQRAKWAGADTVKFQMFHGDRYPHLQLASSDWFELKNAAERLKLRFLATPDDWDDVMFLVGLGVDRLKIGSSNVTNIPLLEKIATLDMPVILSSGACTADELRKAFDTLHVAVIMHCVSAYPAPISDLNLACIRTECCMGYSDHTIGSDYGSALVALGMGARVFEKHLTLAHNQDGPDHQMSADAIEFKKYVSVLRLYAEALGDGEKRIMTSEMRNRLEYDRFVRAQYTLSPN